LPCPYALFCAGNPIPALTVRVQCIEPLQNRQTGMSVLPTQKPVV